MSDLIAERYRLVGTLGEGGMGRVWQARDELLGRDVALKELILPRGLSAAEVAELRERAIREARSAARINHPHVVRIFDVVHAQDGPWIVMELVTSRSLYDMVREDGPMRPERVARIGLDVLSALRAAHRAGVLHRDVKPANVLLGIDGRVVLTDFGLATASGDSAMTSTGIVLGSPSYLAPERALDEGITPAADLWSLGATMYAAVEGRPPYDKSTPLATLAALATQPPRPPERAGVLGPALDGLLRKNPAERIGPDEAERLLREAAEGKPAPAAASAPTSTVTPPAPTAKIRKGRARYWAAAAAVLVIGAGIAARPMLTTARAEEVPDRSPIAGQQQSASPSARLEATASPAAAVNHTVPGAHPSGGNTPVTHGGRPSSAAAGGNTGNIAQPQLATTTSPPPAAVGSPVSNFATGDCLQLDAGSGRIVLWTCNGSDVQKFDFPADKTMRVRGLCVELLGTDDGARLGTSGCTGAAAQQWNYNTSYDLVNLMVTKCTDVPDTSSADGTPAQVWECAGTSNQKWHR
ncbi:serine/threonine protein kinase [Paractinoplanes globisporus]|uniref:non-specific serine/threonine protein kinase n=1 Tax=Paractinoplanes globisporus TaxID=113565 RepID=A0ABW6WES2_9ACTN|nr:serine/threonine protein kinase [Actinoplanes globisporus]